MRIISGEFRGRTISAPKGSGTRPTTDRVRESLMSALSSARGGFDGAVVLDAFAGSGALGLESISRGAAFATFCERDREALRTLESNITKLGLGRGKALVRRSDVMKNPPMSPGRPFDLVYLDPPYAYDAVEVMAMVESIMANGSLSADAIVVYEHDRSFDFEKDQTVADLLARLGLRIVSHKAYGDTAIDIMRRECE